MVGVVRTPVVVRRIGRALAWSVLLASLLLVLVAVVVPRVSGATPYVVLTGSMRPAMPPGTLVVSRPVDPADLEVGDVVTVQLRSGRSSFVTHRIVGIGQTFDGATRFTTQGDANDAPDQQLRRPEQIVGRRWYWVPAVGRLQELMTIRQREDVVRLVGAGLALYAAWSLASAWRDRRRRASHEQRGEEQSWV